MVDISRLCLFKHNSREIFRVWDKRARCLGFVILPFFSDLARNSLEGRQGILFWGWSLCSVHINPLVKKLCFWGEGPDLWSRSWWAMSCQSPPPPLSRRGGREKIKILVFSPLLKRTILDIHNVLKAKQECMPFRQFYICLGAGCFVWISFWG